MVSTRSHGIGSVSDHVQRILIRIDTDGGPSGYGEADPWAVFSGTVESAVSTLQTYLWPQLQHQPIADIPKVMARLNRTVVGQSEAKVAIETALY
jgi:muconate cycloisomerase